MRPARPALVLILTLAVPAAAAPDPPSPDEQLVKGAFLTSDGPALVEFFRKRTKSQATPERIQALIAQLGDATTGDTAAAELVALGSVAVPLLRQAAKDPDDTAAAARARKCLQAIEGASGAAIPAAAARLLAKKGPTGAIEALLDYLPLADDERVVEEVQSALNALAQPGSPAEKVLLQALADPIPIRRIAAAEALAPNPEHLAAVRKLLQDRKPTVRLRIALALVAHKDTDAIPVLIALLDELSVNQGRQAEAALRALAGELAPNVALADDASRQRVHDAWAAWWKDADGPSLLDFFRKRTLKEADRGQIAGLIRKLGDDDFDVREQATKRLVALGSQAEALLSQAAKGETDPEVKRRAQRCLELIQKDESASRGAATARLIALRKPAGAAEVLLAYLPYADASLTDDLEAALGAVAVSDGKADPAVVKALADPLPRRRAIAAGALCRAGLKEHREAIRKLLKDPDAEVRFQVAEALAGAQDREALPVLIALLTELPAAQAWQAEDLLCRFVGGAGPGVTLGRDDAGRKQARDAWAAWWRANSAKTELARLDAGPRLLGYTIMTLLDVGRVQEVAPDGKVRWQLDGLGYPYDVQVLPGDRVLVAEYRTGRVTERTLKNEVVWEKAIATPVSVQRLPNGNTFIASRNQLVEVDRKGQEVRTIPRPTNDVTAAHKLRDGQIICLSTRGQCQRLDADGKEVKSFATGPMALGGLDVLPGGRILVAHYSANKVVEYDADGKPVWEAAVSMPTSVMRLPGGRTLVASSNAHTVLELDRSGKTVWEFKAEGRVWKARRR